MSKISTAKLVLTGKETYDSEYSTVSKHDALEAMIEFAKMHVQAALKQAEEIAVDFDCEGNYDNSILNCYYLENIK
jgi:hypothetical protein